MDEKEILQDLPLKLKINELEIEDEKIKISQEIYDSLMKENKNSSKIFRIPSDDGKGPGILITKPDIITQLSIVKDTVNNCLVEDENGCKYVDIIKKHSWFETLIIEHCTNFHLTKLSNSDNAYSLLISSGVFRNILEYIDDEYVHMNMLLKEMLNEEKEKTNGFDKVVTRMLGQVIGYIKEFKIDEKVVKETFEKMNTPENKELVEKMKEIFNNKVN
jgi:hypothetical protein